MRGRGGGGGGNNRKQPNPLTRSYESNGPDVKVRGTAAHVAEKYQQLARDAQASGDRVAAENYLQHAEHYLRIIAAAQAQQQAAQQEAGGGDQPVRRDNDQRERGNSRRDESRDGEDRAAGEASGTAVANGANEGEGGEDMGLPAFLRNATRTSSQEEDGMASSGADEEQPAKPANSRRRRRPSSSEREASDDGAAGDHSDPSPEPVAETADNA